MNSTLQLLAAAVTAALVSGGVIFSYAASCAITRVYCGHLIAALPMSLAIAATLRDSVPFSRVLGVIGTVGVMAAALTTAAITPSFEAGFYVRCAWRTLTCLALQTPVMLALIGCRSVHRPWMYLPGAAAAAALVPGVLAANQLSADIAASREYFGQGRLMAAIRTLEPVVILTGPNRWSEIPVRSALEELTQQQIDLERVVSNPLPPNSPPERRLQRATQLAQLDRWDEALALADGDNSPRASVLMGNIHQLREQYDASDASFRSLIESSKPATDLSSEDIVHWVQAYDGLAANARATGRTREAEQLLLQALTDAPTRQARAYFHFQLARHYHLNGRPAAALERIEKAVDLDPRQYNYRAERLRTEIQRHTPGCLLQLHSK